MLTGDVLRHVFYSYLAGTQAQLVAGVSQEFAALARTHPDLRQPAAPPGGWPRKLRGPGEVHWRRRETLQGAPGLLISWAGPRGVAPRPSFMCVECGCWDDLQGDPWDVRLAAEDGNPITPRDAADARAWLSRPQPWEHWSVYATRRYYESVLAVWPGDVCRECYDVCPDPVRGA